MSHMSTDIITPLGGQAAVHYSTVLYDHRGRTYIYSGLAMARSCGRLDYKCSSSP